MEHKSLKSFKHLVKCSQFEYLYLRVNFFPQRPAACEIICSYLVNQRYSLFNCRHYGEDYSWPRDHTASLFTSSVFLHSNLYRVLNASLIFKNLSSSVLKSWSVMHNKPKYFKYPTITFCRE